VHEIGVVVWAVVVIAGVVSSIVQSARKRAALNGTPGAAAPASAQRLAEMRRLAQTIAVRVDSAGNIVSPVRPAATAPRPPGAPRLVAPKVAAPAPVTPAADMAAPASTLPAQQAPGWPTGRLERPAHRAIERLYRNRHALADAIVAAEVLGKPLALRNE
jgi:hypothetical protein